MENANNITANNQVNTATHQKICSETFFARPYGQNAQGFYFGDAEEFKDRSEALRDAHGNKVEEFELQYIDGNDGGLFEACCIGQANLSVWFDTIAYLEEYEKAALFFVVAEQGYRLADALDKYDDVSLTQCRLTEAAAELFDEIYLPEVPESIRSYIDYAAFANDCQQGGDMSEFEFAGKTWTCTNANSI